MAMARLCPTNTTKVFPRVTPPALFDVVLTNPPFGGKENADVQTRFDFRTSSTQVLFLQEVMNSLKPGGRCGIVVDEGVMFRDERAFVQTKPQAARFLRPVGRRVAAPGRVYGDRCGREDEPPLLHAR
jgi:N-6 DNA Methylase